MRTKDLRQMVRDLGRNPKYYRYDFGAKNPWRLEGTHVYILINNGKEAKVDWVDFIGKRLYSYRWTALSSDPSKDYPHTNIPDLYGKPTNLYLHILIMGSVSGLVVDHFDGNRYNASRSNLRHVTTKQNNQNRHRPHYRREYNSLWD